MCTVSPLQLSAVLLTLHAVAVSTATFRLFLRWKNRQLWWDDYVAGIALVGDIVYAVGMSLLTYQFPTFAAFLSTVIVPLFAVSFAARLSISLSITKICTPVMGTSWLFRVMNACFVLFFLALPGITTTLSRCRLAHTTTPEPKIRWMLDLNCPAVRATASYTIITDILTDVFLVGVPLRILWHVTLPPLERRLILSVFAATAVASLPAIGYLAMKLTNNESCSLFAVHSRVPTALLSCNLLVFTTYLYRRIRKEDDGMTYITKTDFPPSCTVHFTTITCSEVLGTTNSEAITTTAFTGLTTTKCTISSIAISSIPGARSTSDVA